MLLFKFKEIKILFKLMKFSLKRLQYLIEKLYINRLDFDLKKIILDLVLFYCVLMEFIFLKFN